MQSWGPGDLGANTGTWSVNDSADHTLVLDLRRQGTELHILATLNGAPFDGGRIVTAPHTFTYDSLMLANRTRGVTWVIRTLAVDKLTPVAPVPPLTTWRLIHFGFTDNAGQAADLADPDGDGLANLLEYALGKNPNAADLATGMPTLSTTNVSGSDHLTLTVPKNSSASGLTYIVETSSDLVNWTSGEGHTVIVSENGTSLVVRTHAPLSTQPRQFLRLRVENP